MKIYELACIIGVSTICVTAILPIYKYVRSETQESPQVYITAAHIPSDQIAGYTLMYVDEDRDAAYYLKDDYQYHAPSVGDTVYFNGEEGTVKRVDVLGRFFVETDSQVYQGLSGSRVEAKDGEDIGFISSVKSGELTCVCLK